MLKTQIMKRFAASLTFAALLCMITGSSMLSAENPYTDRNTISIGTSSGNGNGSAPSPFVLSLPPYAPSLDRASYPCEGTVNCRWKQNVRASPWGKIIGGFVPGTKVQVIGREGDWYRISYGSGFAYLHASLVDVPGVPASDGKRPSPYAKVDPVKTEKPIKPIKPNPTPTKPGSSKSPSGSLNAKDINGPDIPDCLIQGLAAAKRTTWFTTPNKCLQFAGTVAYKAGAHVSEAKSIYPHNAYKPDKTLRGSRINSLDEAALAGTLKPGMLIHVKAAYDKDPAYNPVENAHHWFVYMGLRNGIPMFADTLRDGRLQTIDEVDRNIKGGNILKEQYKPYQNIRRVSAVYDPFADQR